MKVNDLTIKHALRISYLGMAVGVLLMLLSLVDMARIYFSGAC